MNKFRNSWSAQTYLFIFIQYWLLGSLSPKKKKKSIDLFTKAMGICLAEDMSSLHYIDKLWATGLSKKSALCLLAVPVTFQMTTAADE